MEREPRHADRARARALRRRTPSGSTTSLWPGCENGVKHTSSGSVRARLRRRMLARTRAIACASVVDVGDRRGVDRGGRARLTPGTDSSRCRASTARRIAAGELPPTQIGGCGCCTVAGSTTLSGEFVGPRRLHRAQRRRRARRARSRERHAERGELRPRGSRPRRRGSRGHATPRRAWRPPWRRAADRGTRESGSSCAAAAASSRAAANDSATNGSSGLVPTVLEPRARRRRMVGDEARVEARGFDRARARHAARRAAGDRQLDRELHASELVTRPAAASAVRASRRTRAGLPPGRGGPTSRRAPARRPGTRR